MDDIARNAGISKRTLYEFFTDKEGLLVEGMQYCSGRMTAYLDELEKGELTALEMLFLGYAEMMKRPRWFSLKFYEDLRKYPKALEAKEAEKEFFTRRYMRLFERGVREGVFQQEVNFEIIALLAKEQVKMIPPSKTFSNHTHKEVYDTVLVAFLRGICTDKGREILDRWIRTNRIMQQA